MLQFMVSQRVEHGLATIHVCVYIYTHIHTIKCHSAIKLNKILLFAAIWMDLDDDHAK